MPDGPGAILQEVPVDRSPTRLYRIAVRVLRPAVEKLYRLRAHGIEHVPKDGGFVVAANHLSKLDPVPLGMPLYPRQLHYMVKAELWKPPLTSLFRAVGTFPVRRGEHDVEAFETAVRIVREGHVMGMFPEGTRRRKGLRKKHVPRPHTGAARIALAARAPLVPAAIRGTDRLLRLGPLRVVYGPPIPLDDLYGRDSYEAAGEATRRLWAEIQRLEAELDAEQRRA
jgi:1-acyl-sn-glycerol-3-phosphate acyltransferase